MNTQPTEPTQEPAQPMLETEAAYLEAGEAFVDLVGRLAPDSWAEPALGVWDLRGLVGHTSRALLTVPYYLAHPADTVACATAAEYFAASRTFGDPNAIAARGVDAGEALGADPARAVMDALARARDSLAAVRGSNPIIETAGGGMHLHAYMPTRTFELVVHSSDIAAASGVAYQAPDSALAATLAVTAELSRISGVGLDLVRQLTGRTTARPLPSSLLEAPSSLAQLGN